MLTAMGDLRRGVARLGAVALLVLLRADVSPLRLQAQAGPTVSRRAGDPGYGPSDTLVHLYKSELSGLEHPLRAVVYDSVAFSNIWRDIMSNRPINPPPPPAVDFGRNMVIVAAMGSSPPPGPRLRSGQCGVWNRRWRFASDCNGRSTALKGRWSSTQSTSSSFHSTIGLRRSSMK